MLQNKLHVFVACFTIALENRGHLKYFRYIYIFFLYSLRSLEIAVAGTCGNTSLTCCTIRVSLVLGLELLGF